MVHPSDFWRPINRAAREIGCSPADLARFINSGYVRGHYDDGVWYLHVDEIAPLRAKAARELKTIPGLAGSTFHDRVGSELDTQDATKAIKRVLAGGAR